MSSTVPFSQWSPHAASCAESGDAWPAWSLAGSCVLHVVVCVAIMSLRVPPVSELPETSYSVALVTLPGVQAFAPPSQAPVEIQQNLTTAPDAEPLSRPPKPQTGPVVEPGRQDTAVQRAEESPSTVERLTRTMQSVRIPAITPLQPSRAASELVPRVPERVPDNAESRVRGLAPLIATPEPPPQLAKVYLERELTPSSRIPPSATSKAKRERRGHAIANLAIPELAAPPARPPDLTSTVREPQGAPTTLHVARSSPGEMPYWEHIWDRIHQEWIVFDIRHSRPLQVGLAFRVKRTGQVSGLTIDRSSGNSQYDAMAKRAVFAASPLPPFPPMITADYRDVNFTFRFHPKRRLPKKQ